MGLLIDQILKTCKDAILNISNLWKGTELLINKNDSGNFLHFRLNNLPLLFLYCVLTCCKKIECINLKILQFLEIKFLFKKLIFFFIQTKL